MAGFENLSEQEGVLAFEALKANAVVLADTANDASARGSYGVARSLLILSSEEFVKGAILYLKSIGIELFRIKEFQKALRFHKERHEVVMLFKLFKILERIAQMKENSSPSPKQFAWLHKAKHLASQALLLVEVIQEAGSDLDWWKNANDFKNDGLYVDYKNQLLLPQSITKSDFELALTKVKDLQKRFDAFQLILERVSQKKRLELIISLNEGIGFYITQNKENKKKTISSTE